MGKKDNTIEKVELTENLLMCFASNVEPTEAELERAEELSIDVKGLREVYNEEPTNNY